VKDNTGTVTGLKILKAIVWFVYMITGAAAIFIAFGFGLLLFNANMSSSFVLFIYRWATFFAKPFAGMITPVPLPNGGAISWSALFAILAYLVLGWIVGAILNSISARIYRDTSRRTVGQSTVVESHPLQDGGTVATQTTTPVVAPSLVEQEDARELEQPEA
jgi:hypothetical protein